MNYVTCKYNHFQLKYMWADNWMAERYLISVTNSVLNMWYLGDNCIENVIWGSILYNFGYTVGNLVLRRRRSKTWFLTIYLLKYLHKWKVWIWLFHSYTLLRLFTVKIFGFVSNWTVASCMSSNIKWSNLWHQFIADSLSQVYCSKFLTLSNQMCYNSKCIRIGDCPMGFCCCQIYQPKRLKS